MKNKLLIMMCFILAACLIAGTALAEKKEAGDEKYLAAAKKIAA